MTISSRNILVTGGAGFIGSHLVGRLIAAGNRVTVLDNLSSGTKDNLKNHLENKNLTFVEGDVRDRKLLITLTKSIDIAYHLAVQCLRVSINNPEINHEVNATGTLNLCMACLENNVNRFIYVSSSEVYGTAITIPMSEDHPLRPMTVYGASKAAGELYTLAYHKTYGLNSMVIRPFNSYGPRSHFEGAYGEVIPKFVLRLLNNLPPVIFGNGEQTRDFIFVTDIVKGMLLASECDEMIGQAVNIARGREVSINMLAEIIAKELGKSEIRPSYQAARPGDVTRHYAAATKANKMFGFTADTDIEDGIRKYIHWFLSQGYDYKTLLKLDRVINWE
jgi:UDP-glucose 4-epimerase